MVDIWLILIMVNIYIYICIYIYNGEYMVNTMGFQLVMGIPPIAGWFISWKIPSFEMDNDWSPYFRRPANIVD